MQMQRIPGARRRAMQAACVLIATLVGGGPACAQSFPDRAIRVVVPFPPGGLIDASMRALAPKMSEVLGQPLVIDNKGGAGGTIGIADVARSPADGYNLIFANESVTLAPFIYRTPGFDPVRDFAPITEVLSVPIAILVHGTLPVYTVKDLIAWSHAHPGTVSAGSGGVGTATHLCLEALKSVTGADYVHIPYKGAGPAFTDFLAGQTQLFAVSTSLSAPQVKAGKIRAIAVASPKRAGNLPDVPTIAEAGFGALEYSTWMGMLAPVGTPAAVIGRIRDAAVVALQDTANHRRFTEQGLEVLGTSPEEFKRFVVSETAKFGKAVAIAGIKPE